MIQETFQKDMFIPFIRVLMGILLGESHDLLREDIIQLMYDISCKNWGLFYGDFIPRLVSEQGLSAELSAAFNGQPQDYPTYSLNMQRFLNDALFYKRFK
jgi:hypothetical protein